MNNLKTYRVSIYFDEKIYEYFLDLCKIFGLKRTQMLERMIEKTFERALEEIVDKFGKIHETKQKRNMQVEKEPLNEVFSLGYYHFQILKILAMLKKKAPSYLINEMIQEAYFEMQNIFLGIINNK